MKTSNFIFQILKNEETDEYVPSEDLTEHHNLISPIHKKLSETLKFRSKQLLFMILLTIVKYRHEVKQRVRTLNYQKN